MYGLPQAGRIADDVLVKHLEPYGYHPCKFTPGLWKHKTKSIMFTLVVDDFGVKYDSKTNTEHLLAALQSKYTVTMNWKGDLYAGISLKWNYSVGTVTTSMPSYVHAALQKFLHPNPTKPQHSPFP